MGQRDEAGQGDNARGQGNATRCGEGKMQGNVRQCNRQGWEGDKAGQGADAGGQCKGTRYRKGTRQGSAMQQGRAMEGDKAV